MTVPRLAAEAPLDEAIEALRASKLVAYPTETFYAVGAVATDERALALLAALKARPAGKAVPLIAADIATALAVVDLAEPLRAAAQQFWPGPLTLAAPPRVRLPPTLLADDGTVGLRVSPHPCAAALARAAGGLVTSTSLNLAGMAPATRLEGLPATLLVSLACLVDGGALSGGWPSTVLSWRDGGPRIVRRGAIGRESLARALGVDADTL